MRSRWLCTALFMVSVSCNDDTQASFGAESGNGGASGAGGTSSAGGGVATGGTSIGAGGTSAGGSVGNGGTPSGGTSGTGGTGGVSGAGSGGTTSTGGAGGASTGGAGGVGAAGMTGTGGVGVAGAGGKSSGGAGGSAAGAAGKGGTGGSVPPDAGAGPPPSVERLFPLAVGNVWNYMTTILPNSTGTSPCLAGMHATTITGRAMFDGQNAFTATHVCAPTTTRYYVENASGLEVNVGMAWSVVLPRPIADGSVFTAASSQEVLGRIADVTVPAGTFSDCWQTAYLTATGPITTYCAGVGLVSLEYDAPNGGGYKLELVSYSLK